jgi:hypothetical protein
MGLLVQAIPYFNRRGNYRDQCWEPRVNALERFIWTRFAFTSACLYPDFATQQEKMVRSTSTIQWRRLARMRGPEELVEMLANLEARMTRKLDSALADQQRWAVPDDPYFYAISIYPECECGGGI